MLTVTIGHTAIVAAATALLIALIMFLVYLRFPIHRIYKSKIGFESMLDAVNEPLAVISDDYTVRRVNKAYIEMVGGSYKTSINAKCYRLLRGLSSPCSDCRLGETLSQSVLHEIDISPHPSGEGSVNITFSPYAMPISGNTAEICVIEHIRDITALERLKNKLERRNNFLTIMSRKLRAAQRNIMGELRIARQVQLGLLPENTPQIENMRFDIVYAPIAEVGGDIYDFVSLASGRLGVFIGDASGHGPASSLIGTLSKMSLYNHSRETLSTARLLESMNRDLKAHIHTSHYLTCFWCIFDFENKKLTYSRAGHPMQIVLRKDGTLHNLSGNGIFLGITDEAVYEEKEFIFKEGDRFYWFTDGIYDVFRKGAKDGSEGEKDFLGYAKFEEMVKQTAGLPFEEIVGTLKGNLTDFLFNDDYTLIVAEICYA